MVEEVVARIKLEGAGGVLGGLSGNQGAQISGTLKQSQESMAKNGKQTAFAVTAGLGIWEGIKKATEALVKASPALAGTLKIFGQTLTLLMKPVGDLISMILRPFALAFLKWAVPFYKGAMKDVQTTGGKAGGVAGGVGGAIVGGKIGAAIGTFFGPGIGTAIGAAIGAFVGLIAGALAGIKLGAIIEGWIKPVVEFLKGINWLDVFALLIFGIPGLIIANFEKVAESVSKFFTETLPFAAGFAFETLVIFFTETLPKLIGTMVDSFFKFFTVTIPNFFVSMIGLVKLAWDGFVQFMLNLPENIMTAFDGLKTFFTETIPGWFQAMFDGIVNIWEGVKGFFGAGQEAARDRYDDVVVTPSGQVIRTSPADYLFATKDPNSLRQGGSFGQAYSPTININAAINSDIDVQRLAERIAEYSKDELARRTNDFRI